MKKFVSIPLLAGLMGVAGALASDEIKIQARMDEPMNAGLKMPFVAAGEVSWDASMLLWSGESLDISAELYGATTREHLLFKVVVHDAEHQNDFYGRNLWRGDSVHFSLDARGNTPSTATQEEPFAADDLVFVCGLGTHGPEAHAVKTGRPPGHTLGPVVQSILRDEAEKTTIYQLAIAWSELSSAYGQSASIGVALSVAHKNREGQDLCWGKTMAGEMPRQLNPVATPTGTEDFVTIAPQRIRLVEASSAEVGVAVQIADGARIIVQLGDAAVTLDSPTGGIQRYVIRVPVTALSWAAHQLQVRVESNTLQQEETFEIMTPSLRLTQFQKKIEALKATADSPWIVMHLESTLALVLEAAQRLDFETEHPERVRELMDSLEMILAKLPPQKMKWSEFLNRGLPLVFAFVSEGDRTLQFYTLQFPYDWNPEESYPLTVYLHGYGTQNPVGYLTTAFDPSHQDTLYTYDVIDPLSIPPAHRGFILAPWARGNSFYQGLGEDDVWQSMAAVAAQVAIDRNRVYLTGFSMGCHGAWALAARTPEVWAGVNLASGFGDWSDTRLSDLDKNLLGTPVVNWIGELDSMVKDAHLFNQRLNDAGLDSQLEVVPNLPHTYPYPAFQKNVGLLLRNTRKIPSQFSMVADTAKHTQCHGIRMNVTEPLDVHALPQFKCQVKGNTLLIESKNTDGLEIIPGKLGRSGTVTVIWNGKKVYTGSDPLIPLGEPLNDPFWHWVCPF